MTGLTLRHFPFWVLLLVPSQVLGQAESDLSTRPAKAKHDFIIGADISWVQAAEDRGVKFSDQGTERDILAILKDRGFNYIRLRVFHDPTKATPQPSRRNIETMCWKLF
jgi:arabinogalactan endo-1,4-beta-galactosidase